MARRRVASLTNQNGAQHPVSNRLKKLAQALWVIPATTLALSSAVILATALLYALSMLRTQWLIECVLLAPLVSTVTGVVSFLGALLLWLTGVFRFREVRRAIIFSVLNVALVWLMFVFVVPNIFRF